jgi:hypothetical protein
MRPSIMLGGAPTTSVFRERTAYSALPNGYQYGPEINYFACLRSAIPLSCGHFGWIRGSHMPFRKVMMSLGAIIAALTMATGAQATWLQYAFKFSGWTHWVDNVGGDEGDYFVRYGVYLTFNDAEDDETGTNDQWAFRGAHTLSNTLASFKIDQYGGEQLITINMPYASGFLGEVTDPAASYFKWQQDGYISFSSLEGTLDSFSRKTSATLPQYGQYNMYVTEQYSLTDPTLAVPEPATWAMMIGGFGFIGATMRRRVRRANRTISFN